MQKHHNKIRWTEEETKKFLELVPKYGKEYMQYTKELHRSYSCVKGQYHNLKRRGIIPDDSVSSTPHIRTDDVIRETQTNSMNVDELVRELQKIFESM